MSNYVVKKGVDFVMMERNRDYCPRTPFYVHDLSLGCVCISCFAKSLRVSLKSMSDKAAVIVHLLKSYRLGMVLKVNSEIKRQWPTVTEFEATKHPLCRPSSKKSAQSQKKVLSERVTLPHPLPITDFKVARRIQKLYEGYMPENSTLGVNARDKVYK